MLAAIILKNLVSFEPFESSLKSSDSVDGRIESLNGPGRAGKALRTNFLVLSKNSTCRVAVE